jgi:hypothetical protein
MPVLWVIYAKDPGHISRRIAFRYNRDKYVWVDMAENTKAQSYMYSRYHFLMVYIGVKVRNRVLSPDSLGVDGERTAGRT